MILKEQENSQRDIETLYRLMAHPAADDRIRQEIADQIRNLKSGDRGEAEAAYEIKFHFGDSPDWVVINDLRIEHDGLVAQIDHLLINRILEFWVCESKRFAGGVRINEHGEFVTFYNGKPQGRSSPIEQNARHIKLLQRLIDSGAINLPSRLGITIKPQLRSLVLISQGAIGRPKRALPGLETVIKNDQIGSTIRKALDSVGPLALTRLVSRATLTTSATSAWRSTARSNATGMRNSD